MKKQLLPQLLPSLQYQQQLQVLQPRLCSQHLMLQGQKKAGRAVEVMVLTLLQEVEAAPARTEGWGGGGQGHVVLQG